MNLNRHAPRLELEPPPISAEKLADLLGFEAPYLIDKLLMEHIVSSADEARALFDEVKRYLVMCDLDRDVAWQMSSLRIDEVWHQFVLFTHEYIQFCRRFFGGYMPHSPSNAPEVAGGVERHPASDVAFAARYEEIFFRPLPELWQDHLHVTADRRFVHYGLEQLTVRALGERVELVTRHQHGDEVHDQVLVRVDRLAEPALRFIARTGTFFARELPGELTAAERVELCAALARVGHLRAAS